MKGLTMTKKLSTKIVSIMLLGGLLFSSSSLNTSFGTQTHAAGVEIRQQQAVGYWDESPECAWFIDADEDAEMYYIKTASEFAAFAKLVNEGITDFEGKTIILTDNIDLGDHYWIPIGCYTNRPFKGVFDGNDFVIYNTQIRYDERLATFDACTNNPMLHVNPAINLFASMLRGVVNRNIKNIVLKGEGYSVEIAR